MVLGCGAFTEFVLVRELPKGALSLAVASAPVDQREVSNSSDVSGVLVIVSAVSFCDGTSLRSQVISPGYFGGCATTTQPPPPSTSNVQWSHLHLRR